MMAEQNQSISWYMLERYGLNALAVESRAHVETAFEKSPHLLHRYAAIKSDTRPMPPFCPTIQEPKPWYSVRRPIMALAYAMALIIITVASVRLAMTPSVPEQTGYMGTKGGDIAFRVVRLRNGIATHDPTTFTDDDRFRFYMTIPEDTFIRTTVEVTVFQGNEIFFPYKRGLRIEGGNLKGLPGSLQFTGNEKVRVCISTGRQIPSRNRIRTQGEDALPEATVCVNLKPEKN